MVMIKNNNCNIGNRIKELRTEQGLSQEQLALSSGITTTYLGLLERNLKNPTVKVLEQICTALHIELSAFFETSLPISHTYDPCTTQILAQVINRNDQEKQLILKLIKDLTRYFDNVSVF